MTMVSRLLRQIVRFDVVFDKSIDVHVRLLIIDQKWKAIELMVILGVFMLFVWASIFGMLVTKVTP